MWEGSFNRGTTVTGGGLLWEGPFNRGTTVTGGGLLWEGSFNRGTTVTGGGLLWEGFFNRGTTVTGGGLLWEGSFNRGTTVTGGGLLWEGSFNRGTSVCTYLEWDSNLQHTTDYRQVVYQLSYIHTKARKLQWNLRIQDMLGQGVLSFIQKWRFKYTGIIRIGMSSFVLYREVSLFGG